MLVEGPDGPCGAVLTDYSGGLRTKPALAR